MNAPLYPTPPSVVAQVAGQPTLSMPEIKVLGHQLFGTEVPTRNRQFLERRLAYRLQEEAFRKVNPELLERNRRRIATLVETGKRVAEDRSLRAVVLSGEGRGFSAGLDFMSFMASSEGPKRPEPFDDRPRDHRHPLVGPAVLRAEGPPKNKGTRR